MNFVFISDDNFAMPTAVALTSLKINKQKNTIINVYILCNNLSLEQKKRIEKLNDKDFNIIFIDLEKIDNITKYSIKGITANSTAIYKFYIQNILKDLDKVIYVDGDVIFNRGIESINNYDIGDNYVGAVIDHNINYFNRLKYKNYSYFNSGILVLNLKKLRDDNMDEKLIYYRNNKYNDYMDQDTLNYVFKNKVSLLPLRFNLQVALITNNYSNNKKYHYSNVKKRMQLCEDSLDDVINNSIIIHYCDKKPWRFNDVPLSEKWDEYFYKSPYKDNEINLKNGIRKKKSIIKKIKTYRRYLFLNKFTKK